MADRESIMAGLRRHRLDAALVAVLLVGSLGFDDGVAWLSPEAAPAPKAFAVIARPPAARHGPRLPTLPRLALGAGPVAPQIDAVPPSAGGLPAGGPDAGAVDAGAPGGGIAGARPGAAPRAAFVRPGGLNLGNGPSSLSGGFAAASRSAAPVPEPASWALIVLGTAIMAMAAWRRRGAAGV